MPSAPGGGSFVGHPSSPPSGQPSPIDDDYAEPIEPDELVGELEAKSPEEQAEFIRRVFTMVQADEGLQSAVMAGLAGVDDPGDVPGDDVAATSPLEVQPVDGSGE
jgi:hypothetical protein